ncbi:hypothetical protein BJ875DRAFT_371218 [Amylocarpus encephaloides]|uniref:Cell wall proline rich protein n=1 Tax=Amylocarpus encephaloides TaxID=45428 RepID=A0A9P7YN64_9HELO|nr:hypothetical protein BJ875DRAFT_371218 [Amylocarpus encephaloides]
MTTPRTNNGPAPLPPFVFPAKPPTSAPPSMSRASGRRNIPAIEIMDGPMHKVGERDRGSLRTPELPAWSFASASSSPPASPRSQNIPSRPGSHQRGTSEFIGGDGTPGSGNAPMSASPTKGDGVLPQPKGFGPPGGRRGHRHVRSAAISQNDLSMILHPPPSSPSAARGNSAPCSPAGDQELPQSAFPDSMDMAMKRAIERSDSAEPTESGIDSPRESLKPLNRARVGFSETLEFIPRPLSMVSSDSSSTVRQGHSVSNSISSIISAGTSSPSSKEKRGMAYATRRPADNRPRTAEPLSLDREGVHSPDEPKRRNSIPLLMEAAAAAAAATSSVPSTPKSTKRWSFFGVGGHDNNSGDSSPKSRPTSASSGAKESKSAHTDVSSNDPAVNATDFPLPSIERSSSRRSSISRKPSKKQKKVRTWAGSILSRKSRQRNQKQKSSRRSPTPPQRSYLPIDDVSRYEFPQPQAEPPMIEPSIPEPDNDISSWKPRRLPPQDPQDDDSMSPMIDLDAALGPFNTPSTFGEDWENSQKTGPKKRAMHSAAGLGGFAGPGMHYHRRAESAPEFENPRFGLHRLGSSSTMAMEDVFEEDEDAWEDAKASSDKEDASNATEDEMSNGLGIDIKVEDMEDLDSDRASSMRFDDEDSKNRGIKRKGSGLSEGDRRTVGTAKSEHSATSIIDEPIMEESGGSVEIIDDHASSRPDSRARSSDSTATPPFRPCAAKELAPVEVQSFSMHPPYLTPTSPLSTTQSSFPSPRSPFYDAQRISTAPSSVTDDQGFQSLLLGEPGPELRHSVDDVPSLTSSTSTTTKDSAHPGAGNPQFRDGQRSASMSSTAASPNKRGSVISLSRFLGSSHGEKSKLSIESRAPEPTDSDKEKKGKKRISRLMSSFFKPKAGKDAKESKDPPTTKEASS